MGAIADARCLLSLEAEHSARRSDGPGVRIAPPTHPRAGQVAPEHRRHLFSAWIECPPSRARQKSRVVTVRSRRQAKN
jgi:hypothetical protein